MLLLTIITSYRRFSSVGKAIYKCGPSAVCKGLGYFSYLDFFFICDCVPTFVLLNM